MIKFDDASGENTIEHNPDRHQRSDHPCRIIIIGGSGRTKNNKRITEANKSSTRY